MPIFQPHRNTRWLARRRAGITLAELLSATFVITLLAGAMGTLSYAVRSANDFVGVQTNAAQHARVALERIGRNVEAAKASEAFPGCVVASTTVGSYSFPDRLIIWKSNGVAASQNEYPKISDLIVYTYDPANPSRLLEVTDTSLSVPLTSTSQVALNLVVETLLASLTSSKVVVTDQLHAPTATSSRGAIRFRTILSPTATQWSEYRAGTRTWGNIDWPLDIYGTTQGTRRVSCLTELQLRGSADGTQPAIPFYGSATLIHTLKN